MTNSFNKFVGNHKVVKCNVCGGATRAHLDEKDTVCRPCKERKDK